VTNTLAYFEMDLLNVLWYGHLLSCYLGMSLFGPLVNYGRKKFPYISRAFL